MLNYTKDIYPINNQIKRIFCAYHDKQFLTNFCQQNQNNASCPYVHPVSHSTHNNTSNRVKNPPTQTQTKLQIKQNKAATVQQSQCNNIKNQTKTYFIIYQIYKPLYISNCNKKGIIFLTQLQARLIKQIKDSYLEKNVYSIQESLNASKYIDEEISNLYEKISLLKGEDCLSSLITYYAVDQENYKEALVEFDQYFQKNRKAGKLEISILEDNLNKIVSNFCDNVLSVQSIVENFEPKIEEQMIQNDSLKSKRYGFSKMNQKSLQKQQQPKRRTIFDKQNQQGNNNRSSPKKFQKPQNLVINSKQQKNSANDISFNGDNNQKMRSNQSIHTKSINQFSKHNSRRSEQHSSFAQNYESKRFTRQFKKIN